MFQYSSPVDLTYISLTSFLWVIDKQNSPRCDAAKRGVLPGAVLFAFNRELFVRASYDSRETFVRVSHDVRANFNQFYFSQLSPETVLFMSHICRIVQIAETSLRCVKIKNVCEGLATGSRHMR